MRRYRIPPRYFHDLISGAEMDLTEIRYATFERLHEYCYRVAGTVGLTCLHVLGSTIRMRRSWRNSWASRFS